MINTPHRPPDEPFMAMLTTEEKRFLTNRKTTLTVAKGENIIKQNTFISNIVYIKKGIISLILEGERYRNICIHIAGDGDIIGISDLFSNSLHSYTAYSLKPSTISIFQVSDFRSVINKNIRFREKILEHYSGYIMQLHSKLMVIGTKQLHGRLADTLIYLEQIKRKITDIYHHVTRRDIALLTGTSVENVVRLLKEFQHDGIVKISGKEIAINNMEILTKLRKIG
ncbi:MAG: Crp/Fnr family transcriptional regulator [Bacteroidales bacterium]|nr:Crp/Fnr family transcriptional regulator [Bacteroidales bacterium]